MLRAMFLEMQHTQQWQRWEKKNS